MVHTESLSDIATGTKGGRSFAKGRLLCRNCLQFACLFKRIVMNFCAREEGGVHDYRGIQHCAIVKQYVEN